MSFCYAVEAILSMPCNRENVLQILERGKQLNVIFFNNLDANCDSSDPYQSYTHLSLEQAVEAFFTLDYDPFMGRSILARAEGIGFAIRIAAEAKNTLLFSLERIGFSGEKCFFASGSDEYAVNFDRYIRFLLKWCSDFPILRFETSTY